MPIVVRDELHGQLHAAITNRNMLWQYEFLIDSTRLTLDLLGEQSPRVTYGLIQSFHHFALVNLCSNPGQPRKDFVHINGSPHEHPHPDQVENLLIEVVITLHQMWDGSSALDLASYALWRLTWIHPFEEGNGRTARALAYYILCVKLGQILPGRVTIPELIRTNPQPYYSALRHADDTFAAGALELRPLSDVLEGLLRRQLESALSA